MRYGWILMAFLLVIASESRSEQRQSARDFFPREGIVKTYRSPLGTGSDTRQTYRDRVRFRDTDATAILEEVTTPEGRTERSIHYYKVLDDRWSLLGSQRLSRNVTVLYEPAIAQFRVPLRAGERWRQDYTERIVLPGGEERSVRCSTEFVVYGTETIAVSGKKYDCWKTGYEITTSGKRAVSVVSWIAKSYGTVRKTAQLSNGKMDIEEMETFRFDNAGTYTRSIPGPGSLVSVMNRQ